MATVQTLGIDSTDRHDLFLDNNNNLVVKTDQNALADILTERLSTMIGELVFDKQAGLPYLDTAFVTGARVATLRAAMIQTILATPYVVRLVSLDLWKVDTTLNFQAEVMTRFGVLALRNS